MRSSSLVLAIAASAVVAACRKSSSPGADDSPGGDASGVSPVGDAGSGGSGAGYEVTIAALLPQALPAPPEPVG
jgi:hypothetical protein